MGTTSNSMYEELKGTASEIINQIKRLLREGNLRSVVIKNRRGKILFQSQMTAAVTGGAILIFIAPVLSAITVILLFVNSARVFVEKENRSTGAKKEDEHNADFTEPVDDDD